LESIIVITSSLTEDFPERGNVIEVYYPQEKGISVVEIVIVVSVRVLYTHSLVSVNP
jgi:hypothetical protein